MKACDIVPDDERTGRAAGVACAASGATDVVDAIVVATAVRRQAPIVTSDRGDLSRIAHAVGVKIQSGHPARPPAAQAGTRSAGRA